MHVDLQVHAKAMQIQPWQKQYNSVKRYTCIINGTFIGPMKHCFLRQINTMTVLKIRDINSPRTEQFISVSAG